MARLSWPGWLVTHWDGLPTPRQSPIQVLTRPDREQLHWSRPTRYNKAKLPLFWKSKLFATARGRLFTGQMLLLLLKQNYQSVKGLTGINNTSTLSFTTMQCNLLHDVYFTVDWFYDIHDAVQISNQIIRSFHDSRLGCSIRLWLNTAELSHLTLIQPALVIAIASAGSHT